MNKMKPQSQEEIERQKQLKIKKQKQLKRARRKMNVVRFVSMFLVGCLLVRVLYIKVVKGAEYEKMAVIQPTTQTNEQILTAQRGDILDRTGKPLAISSSVYKVFVDVIVMNELSQKKGNETIIDDTAKALNEILGYDINDFKAIFEKNADGSLKNNTKYLVIQKDIPYSKAKEIRDKKLSSIHLEEDGKRIYPYNNVAAQTIGFIGGDGKNSNWGLENYYDKEMTGTDGRYFVSYDDNKIVKDTEIAPISGNTLVTTLDLTMQQFCDELVDKYGIAHGAKNAGIIIMKPQTGEIIAMSEYPRFDNNNPSYLSLVTDPNFLAVDEALPDEQKGDHIFNLWKNFSIANSFEPGSIYKPITVSAALEENIIHNEDTFYCPGYKTYPDGTTIKCWVYDSTGAGHGKQNVEESLANSCNVAMMEIGAKMGRDIFASYQKDFGFGSVTGIDLPGEESVKANVYSAKGLNEVELGTSSFGQGFNSTLLQDIVSVNAVINGGKIVRPYVVSEILDEDGKVVKHFEPEIVRQVISKETSDIVRKDLESTVIYGTGKNVAVDGYSIGGKTGTAEQVPRNSGKYALSFVGFIPVENPEYIAIGVLNEPNDYLTKHTSAVPMMHEVFQKMITYFNIPSDKESKSLKGVDKIFMKDYQGSVVDAVKQLNLQGYSFQITGSGDTVYQQNPKKDQPISTNTNVFLFVQPSSDAVLDSLIEVPDLSNLELEEAKKVVEDLGFTYIATPEVSSEKTTETTETTETAPDNSVEVIEEKYHVVKQMPTKGVSLPKNTEIRIIYR